MKLRPLGRRILVRRKSDEKLGAVIIPETTKKVSLRGEVVSTGEDCVWIVEGDDIFFGRYAPFELPVNYYNDMRQMEEKELLIMNEEDVICKISSKD